jgi:putative FmdB family regulatory protein
MPTYEYRCKDCAHELEAVQGFHDEPLAECPSCGGTLKKKFGSVGISFKGSGFYKNDSRSTSSGSSDTKSESKSEAKSGDGAGSSDKAASSSDSKASSSDSSGSTSSTDSSSTPAAATPA